MTSNLTEAVPLEIDGQGVWRIGRTRVSLETLVAAYDAGATAEEIVQQYPAISLADVYSVIGYFLHHPEEVGAYLTRRRQEAAGVAEEVERRFPANGLRERLMRAKERT